MDNSGSAVVAGLTVVINTQTDIQTDHATVVGRICALLAVRLNRATGKQLSRPHI